MPETMSPREKVEQAVMVCPQCEGEGEYADGLDDTACSTPCTRCGSNGWVVDLAALASSGDHAELAGRLWDRLDDADAFAAASALEALIAENAALRSSLKKANDGFEEYERKFYLATDEVDRLKLAICGGEDVPGSIAAVTVEDCERFCRENHAARGDFIDRATEAERKLAEAVGLLRDLASWFDGSAYNGAWVIRSGDLGVDDAICAARTFLSKEAERG